MLSALRNSLEWTGNNAETLVITWKTVRIRVLAELKTIAAILLGTSLRKKAREFLAE